MANIIPRWEWRTFGDNFGEADQRIASLQPGGVQESDETYFLSDVADENVKVRDQLMDIKKLEQVNADGLEQWKPVMKGGFSAACRRAQESLREPWRFAADLVRSGIHAGGDHC